MDTLVTIASLVLASCCAAGAAILLAPKLGMPALVTRFRARAGGLLGWTMSLAAAAFLVVGVLLMTGLLGGRITAAWAGAGLWLCIVGPIVATTLASPESPAATSAPAAATKPGARRRDAA